MSKKKEVVIQFGGHRVLLSTVASYRAIRDSSADGTNVLYGIEFTLRNGLSVKASGSDPVGRNKALKFVDNYFRPNYFHSDKCTVCEYYKKKPNGHRGCDKPEGPGWGWCDYSNNYEVFKRKEDDTRNNNAPA